MDKSFGAIMEHFRKTGDFTPELVNVGGVLRPQESEKFIDLVVKGSSILSRVTVDRSQKLSKDVNVWELVRQVLQRVPQGVKPSEYTKFANVGKRLEMRDATLFSRILFDFLRDNKHRANLESMVQQKLAEAYGNDVALLACIGEADDYNHETNKSFEALHKGWPQLAKEGAGTHKIDISDHISGSPAAVGWEGLFAAMIEAMPDIYKGDKTVFVVSRADAELYQRQIGQMVGGLAYLLKKQDLTYLGYEIVALNEMPRNTVMFTPLPNLIFGVNTQIERYREVSGQERCIHYTFDSNFDFQIAIDDAMVVAWDRSEEPAPDPDPDPEP